MSTTTVTKINNSPIATAELRSHFGRSPSSVVAVAGLVDGQPDGMVVATFVGLSLEPALVSISIQKSSRTWTRLRELGHLGLTILSSGQDKDVFKLASREGDRFSEIEWFSKENSAIGLTDGAAYFECSLTQEVEAGDHIIAILQVNRAESKADKSPLVFVDSAFTQAVESAQ